MAPLKIHVEGFGGHSTEETVKELAVLAARLGLWVTCDVNGIHVMAGPDDNPATLWGNYEKARDRKATFVSANVIPRGVPGPPDGPDIPPQPMG
jgi:hypothetical protein